MKVYSKYHRRASRRKTTKRSFRKAGIGLLVVTGTIAIILQIATWLNAGELFHLKEIKIVGSKFIRKSELLQLAAIDSSRNLFDYDLEEIAKRVEKHTFVKKVSVKRRFPATLLIQIEARMPLALLSQNELIAIDEEGKPMPKPQPDFFIDYPIITNLPSTENKTGALQTVLGFLYYLKKEQFALYSEISDITYLQNVGIHFHLYGNCIPVFFGKENLEDKAVSFMIVLKKIKTTKTLAQIQYFDLRFGNQVVVKEI